MAGGRDALRRRALIGAVLLAAIMTVLWRPIVRLPTHTFGPFDLISQSNVFTRVDPGHAASNTLLGDPTVQMHPWARFAEGELAAGRWPLWNPYSASGEPLVANFQSGVFSPFVALVYVLPFKLAVLGGALLKLFLTALFSALFLRRIGCARGAALFGGLAFAASGVVTMLVQHPHTGALAMLPSGLYFTEVAFASLERGSSAKAVAALAALAASIGIGILAGHPETFFFCAVVLASYAPFRYLRSRERGAASQVALPRIAAGFALAAVLGLAIGAVQILPFAEYLAQSPVVGADRAGALFFRPSNWPLHVFPHLAGSPMDARLRPANLPWPNYQETSTFFVGFVPIAAAVVGLWAARKNRCARFFGAWLVLALVYGFDVLGIGRLLHDLTPLGEIPVHRIHPWTTAPACFLAALGLSRLELRSRVAPRWLAAALAVAGMGVLAFALLGAERFAAATAAQIGWDPGEYRAAVEGHLQLVTACSTVGIVGLAMLSVARGAVERIFGYASLLGSVAVTSAQTVAGYVPTVEDRFVFPRTQGIEELREAVGSDKLVVVGADQLVPEFNVEYGLRTIGGYDVLGVGDYARLAQPFFDVNARNASPRRATRNGLELFGVRYVLSRGPWVAVGTDLGERSEPPHHIASWAYDQLFPRTPCERGWRSSERLRATATRDGLDGVAVQLALEDLDAGGPDTEDREAEGEIAFSVRDVETGRELAWGARRADELAELGGDARELSVVFEPLEGSAGREIEVDLRSESVRFRVLRCRGPTWDGQPRKPLLDLGYGQRDFELVGTAAAYRVYRYARSPGRAWLVGAARRAESHEDAFLAVTDPAFRPLDEAVVEGLEGPEASLPARPGIAGRVEIVADDPCRVGLRAECEREALLVLSQPWFPGWTARVGGEARPLIRANYAFAGVLLPPGAHEVELVYDPLAFRFGLGVSLLAAAVVIAAAWFALRPPSAPRVPIPEPRRVPLPAPAAAIAPRAAVRASDEGAPPR